MHDGTRLRFATYRKARVASVKRPQAQALVVSGFLGSGKTTLVRRLLEEGQKTGVRTAVVSNEFGELGIDESLLAATGGDFVELAGGCVCCRLSDDLLKTLQQLWERAQPERVIVETSGVALPYDTLINFWRDPVREWAVDESSVVVVSAEQVAAGRDLDATFEDQVCSADLLLLSKTDLVTAEQADEAEALLARMQPGVTILRADFGNVDPRVFFPPEFTGPESTTSESTAPLSRPPARNRAAIDLAASRHAHDDYSCTEIAFARGIEEGEVQRTLESRAALRAKGYVETAAGVRLVQGVAGRIELSTPAFEPPPQMIGRVVVIERSRPDAHTSETGGHEGRHGEHA
jgi:G3E family GTPase